MRAIVAKRLREIIDPTTPFQRQMYRKLKKYYTRRVPRKYREEFLEAVEDNWQSLLK